jgi:hypothetical protein
VCTALASIIAFNYRQGFHGFEHGYRVFADADDAGLLICTWAARGQLVIAPLLAVARHAADDPHEVARGRVH